jgi:hypothetical protein
MFIPRNDVGHMSLIWTDLPCVENLCRSQWPCGLSHELSSLVRTLGSWVGIPLKAGMFVCVYSVFLLSCVQVVAFRLADPPSKSPIDCVRINKLKKRPRFNKGLKIDTDR